MCIIHSAMPTKLTTTQKYNTDEGYEDIETATQKEMLFLKIKVPSWHSGQQPVWTKDIVQY